MLGSWRKHFRSASRLPSERRAFLRELSKTLCPTPSCGLAFADAPDALIFGGGEYQAMTRPGCTIRAEDTAADDWQLVKLVGGKS